MRSLPFGREQDSNLQYRGVATINTVYGNSTARALHMEPYTVHTTAPLETPDERGAGFEYHFFREVRSEK